MYSNSISSYRYNNYYIYIINNYKEKRKEYIKECYIRQNEAFFVSRAHSNKGYEYNSYNKIRIPVLYFNLKYYENETGNILILADIEDYLSTEYEEDGTLRIYKNYPSIKSYIDFVNDVCFPSGSKYQDFTYKFLNIESTVHEQYQNFDLTNYPLPFVDEMIKKFMILIMR